MTEGPRSLTALDVQIAESKVSLWLCGATVIAAALAYVGAPAASVAMIPFTIVTFRNAAVQWRRRRAARRPR